MIIVAAKANFMIQYFVSVSRNSFSHSLGPTFAAPRPARAQIADRPVIASWDRLIGDEVQQRGTVDHTPLYPREVVKGAGTGGDGDASFKSLGLF